MADKKDKVDYSAVERLSKYVPLPPEDLGFGTIPPVRSTFVSATRAENLASGKGRETAKYMAEAETDLGKGRKLRPMQKENVDEQMQQIGELADQYKRETRGKEDTSVRGKIRKITGYAKGGSVSARADGIAQRGKTKGRIV